MTLTDLAFWLSRLPMLPAVQRTGNSFHHFWPGQKQPSPRRDSASLIVLFFFNHFSNITSYIHFFSFSAIFSKSEHYRAFGRAAKINAERRSSGVHRSIGRSTHGNLSHIHTAPDEFSTVWKFVLLVVPFTRNLLNCEKFRRLAVQSSVWTERKI